MTLVEVYDRAQEQLHRHIVHYKRAKMRNPGSEEVANIQDKIDYMMIVVNALKEKAEREGVDLDGEE